MHFTEHRKRSLVKALTYRIISLIIDATVVFAITNRYDTTLKVIIASNTASIFIYFIHERLWNKLSFGKKAHQILPELDGLTKKTLP